MQVWFLGWDDPWEEEKGNPLQYSCLKNPMERGAWQATQSKGWQRARDDWANEHTCGVLGETWKLLSSRARKGHEPASGGVRESFMPVPLLKLLRFKTVKCQQQMSYYIAQGTTLNILWSTRMENNMKKNIYAWKPESLCCIVEINTTL